MRSKRPKEREKYVLRMDDGTFVEVSREVYLEWHQSRRREKYQKERNQKNRVCSYEELEKAGSISVMVKDSLEETALRNFCREKIREVVDSLPMEDTRLVHLLFFEEVPVNEVAKIYGCSRRTIQNRRDRILSSLRQTMLEMGIQGGCF